MSPRPGRYAEPALGVTTRAAWVGRVVGAVVTCLALGSLGWYVGMLPYPYLLSLLLCLALGSVVFGVAWTAQEHGRRLEAAAWFVGRREESAPPASLDYRMLRLRRDLRDALERTDRGDPVYALVRELTAERLSAKHGIDLEADPTAAARLLPDGLRTYLNHPPKGTERRSRRELERAIDGIETL